MLKKVSLLSLLLPAVVLATDIPPLVSSGKSSGNDDIKTMVRAWSAGMTNLKPTIDHRGVKRYAYGYSMPLVVCSPFHLCTIHLEEGESIDDVVIGDKRFQVKAGSFGKEKTPVLWVKPSDYQLQTNMVITTDRRVYQFLVASPAENKSSEVTPNIGFYYPADMLDEWKSGGFSNTKKNNANSSSAVSNETTEASTSPLASSSSPFVFDARSIYDNYSLSVSEGSAEDNQVPSYVFDNGTQTFIRFDREPQSLPVFSVLNKNGTGEVLVNWRFVEGYYVIDRISDRMQLRIGGLESGLKIIIEREPPKKKGFFSSVFGD